MNGIKITKNVKSIVSILNSHNRTPLLTPIRVHADKYSNGITPLNLVLLIVPKYGMLIKEFLLISVLVKIVKYLIKLL